MLSKTMTSVAEEKAVLALDESALIRFARQGEHWAFDELCRRNSRRVFHAIYRVTRNREDAEDALQDSIMKAFLHLDQFKQNSTFSSWLTRIGINSALMMLRRRRYRAEVSIDESSNGDEGWFHNLGMADSSIDPEWQCLLREREVHLELGIQRLPTPFRTVIQLRRSTEGSMEEIASTMGITVSAAKSRLSRAKRRLSLALA
jgi:RNA polymerase sigma-70 factor (ECF subfamily)